MRSCNTPVIIFINVILCSVTIHSAVILEKTNLDTDTFNISMLNNLNKVMIATLKRNKMKGVVGKIGVIGGSTEHTGAPYFAALAALEFGADTVFVITTESAAQIIETYSAGLSVYPFLDAKHLARIKSLLVKMDVVIIGPGLGTEDETLSLLYDIIQHCKRKAKPLVIDGDGIYALSKNPTILNSYPEPGVILTPTARESKLLKKTLYGTWYYYWGKFVSVLVKGAEYRYYAPHYTSRYTWSLTEGKSGIAGQSDILSGALGMFYNWALNINLCDCLSTCKSPVQLAKSVAAYTAAKFTGACDFETIVVVC